MSAAPLPGPTPFSPRAPRGRFELWRRVGRRVASLARRLAIPAREHPRSSALAAIAVIGALALFRWSAGAPAGVAAAEVREGPFRVSLIESGTLQALRSISYASAIQSNQAKIIALAPEGKLVQKRDLLILFDAAPFEEEIRRSQAALSQAEADLQKARQDFNLQRIQNQEELQAARQKSEKSDLELRDTQEGKGKLKEEEAAAEVASAEREAQKAETAFQDLKPLLALGFITRLELERAAQQLEKAREDLALAKRRRDTFLSFGRPLELSQARAEALTTHESVKQLESAGAYRLEARQSAISAAESRIQEAAAKLALARQQLARTEVRADVPGIVVYRDVFFGSEQRKPQVGDQVWSNQPLLILPDVSKMVVETKVRETDIHKVADNQRVAIRVDAYPELRLTGAVSLVGTLAQEERERRGVKFFSITVRVNESDPRLRPGMTARVEVQVEERPRATFVPLEAVVERDGRSLCFVAGRGQPEPREVVLGPSNADFVVIERGLVRGERVLLRDPAAPPSEFGAATSR